MLSESRNIGAKIALARAIKRYRREHGKWPTDPSQVFGPERELVFEHYDDEGRFGVKSTLKPRDVQMKLAQDDGDSAWYTTSVFNQIASTKQVLLTEDDLDGGPPLRPENDPTKRNASSK